MRELAIARRYSAALLADAADEEQAREYQRALDVAVEVLMSGDARAALTSPSVTDEDRQAVLEELCKAMQLPQSVTRFLLVLLGAGRIGVLEEAAAVYRSLFEDRFRLRRAIVETATPIDDDLADKLKNRLEKMTGDRIELEFVEAPQLLAGWRARVGNHLVEADLAGQVRRLRDRVVKG